MSAAAAAHRGPRAEPRPLGEPLEVRAGSATAACSCPSQQATCARSLRGGRDGPLQIVDPKSFWVETLVFDQLDPHYGRYRPARGSADPAAARGERRVCAQGEARQAGYQGRPAVIVSVQKQPGADTVKLTSEIESALAEMRRTLPAGIGALDVQFRQASFIEASIANMKSVLVEAAAVVAVVLFRFLLDWRATAISLTAISILITVAVFQALGLTIITMTLGGLAIAIGEIVDDAVVDVENIRRRPRERQGEHPRPIFEVVAAASQEVRSGIFYATAIIILVFVPLFALAGIEGRLFAQLGIAYIVSILASLVTAVRSPPCSPPTLFAAPLRGSGRRTRRAGSCAGSSPSTRAPWTGRFARRCAGDGCRRGPDRAQRQSRSPACPPAALQRGHAHDQHGLPAGHQPRRIEPPRPHRREPAARNPGGRLDRPPDSEPHRRSGNAGFTHMGIQAA